MENKELYKKEYNKGIVEALVEEGDFTLRFVDGEVKFESCHESDCCENVYADFSVMKYYAEKLVKTELKELIIKGVKDMGFLMCFGEVKAFIPCYDYQNGYYSDNLTLKITEGDTVTNIDLNELIEHHID